jgi:hypothetical protein
MTLTIGVLLVALACFILDALGVQSKVSLVPVGLACVTVALLLQLA